LESAGRGISKKIVKGSKILLMYRTPPLAARRGVGRSGSTGDHRSRKRQTFPDPAKQGIVYIAGECDAVYEDLFRLESPK